MASRFRHLRDDERGMSMMFVGAGFLAFFAATGLSIEVGMYMNARSQSQNAADAGAHSGAVALALDNFDDRSSSGPAVQSAMSAALENQVIHGSVSVQPADVTFPAAPNGQFNRVRVNVFRTGARLNPVASMIGPMFGINSVDVGATATGEAAPANAMTCVRPFTIPDRWIENNIPANDTFDRYNNRGQVIPNADVYLPWDHPDYDGYDAGPPPEGDKGTLMTLRAGTGNNVAPTMYNSWNMPGGDIGGDYYEENIRLCNHSSIGHGYDMTQEPGNMVGPTVSGIDDLIAQDPTAYWDETSNSVKSPLGRSPRIFPIPLYDPDYFQLGKQTGRNASLKLANWLGFFVEGRNGNEIYGRITPILGTIDPNAGPAPEGSFPRAVRLVQ